MHMKYVVDICVLTWGLPRPCGEECWRSPVFTIEINDVWKVLLRHLGLQTVGHAACSVQAF